MGEAAKGSGRSEEKRRPRGPGSGSSARYTLPGTPGWQSDRPHPRPRSEPLTLCSTGGEKGEGCPGSRKLSARSGLSVAHVTRPTRPVLLKRFSSWVLLV